MHGSSLGARNSTRGFTQDAIFISELRTHLFQFPFDSRSLQCAAGQLQHGSALIFHAVYQRSPNSCAPAVSRVDHEPAVPLASPCPGTLPVFSSRYSGSTSEFDCFRNSEILVPLALPSACDHSWRAANPCEPLPLFILFCTKSDSKSAWIVLLRGIPFWVFAYPSVVVDGRVHRVRGIGHIMTEPSGIEDRRPAPHPPSIRVFSATRDTRGRQRSAAPTSPPSPTAACPLFPESGSSPSAPFFASLLALKFRELPVKIVAPHRQRPHAFHPFEIDEVVRLLCVLERRLRLRTPAVGLRS